MFLKKGGDTQGSGEIQGWMADVGLLFLYILNQSLPFISKNDSERRRTNISALMSKDGFNYF